MVLPTVLLNFLFIAVTYSVVQVLFLEKIKELPFLKKGWMTWAANFILAFLLGMLYSIYFFKLDVAGAAWVSLFSFLGASQIYESFIKIRQSLPKEEE